MDRPREKAAEILWRVEQGAFADALLDRARRQFAPRDSAFMLELVYGVLRNRSRIDWILEQFSAQPLARTDAGTRNILRLAAYQMLFLDKVPVSAAVNTAVELAKQHGGKSGYVNGLLRSLDRNRASVASAPVGEPARKLSVLYSHPEWLVKRWITRFGSEKTERILQENNHPAPLTIRANTLRTTRDDLQMALETQGAATEKTAWSESGLRVLSSPGITALPAFAEGLFAVQDEAAQLIAGLLRPEEGDAVLDACAAPGGKATHLAELMKNKGTLIALESDPGRIGKIEENSRRLGTAIVKPVLGDASVFHKGAYHKILIDAPCSGLGVLRRHPDGRWNKSRKIIAERAAIQFGILRNCASLLKPGGALVYATCTTEPEENEHIISSFLAANPQFRIDDPRPFLPDHGRNLADENGFFRTFPDIPSLDGFFGVRLIKR